MLKKPLLALLLAISYNVYAENVNQGNITDFSDGTPAFASQVNANFGELISQINNNDGRIDALEQSALVSGNIGLSVNCETEGADALENAISTAKNPAGNLYINASGTCDAITIKRSGVVIIGTPLVTIQSDSMNAPPITIKGALNGVVLLDVIVDATGASRGIVIGPGTLVAGANLSVKNATDSQVTVDGGRLFLAATNSFGEGMEDADALTITLHGAVGVLPFGSYQGPASLALISDRTALNLSGASIFSSQFTGSSISISGFEVEVGSGSNASFGVADIDLSDRFAVRDNSILNVAFSSDTGAFTLDGKLLLDMGGVGRVDMEGAEPGVSLTHTGDLEVGGNSYLEVYGQEGTSDKVTMASGGEAGFFVNSTFVGNSMTFGATAIEVLDATFALTEGTALSTSPSAIDAFLGGKVIFKDGLINTAIASCSTGGTAFEFGGLDLCPVPPS